MTVPRATCPVCLHKLNVATDFGVGTCRAPVVGDRTFCAYCGSLLRLVTLVDYAVMTDAEIAALAPEERTDIEDVRAAATAFGWMPTLRAKN